MTKADEKKNELYGYAASLFELAKQAPFDKRYEAEFKKYLVIRKANKPGTASVSMREDVLEKELRHTGWMVLMSNHIKEAGEALRIYSAILV